MTISPKNRSFLQAFQPAALQKQASGAVQDIRLLLEVGWEAANQDEMQTWSKGDEFEAARKAALKAVSQSK